MPCSGAQRRGEALDEVSAAIPGDGVAGNDSAEFRFCRPGKKVNSSRWFGSSYG